MQSEVNTKEEVVERLRSLAPELRLLGVVRLGLFGSFVREQPSEHSDVDILVDFAPGRKTFDNFMSLAQRLEDTLQRRVELITRESLSPHVGPQVLETIEYVSFAG